MNAMLTDEFQVSYCIRIRRIKQHSIILSYTSVDL